MPTFALMTFGCKVNQYETQSLREALRRRGLAEVSPTEAADVYVVNTCCVTAGSHRKSLRRLRRLARERPEALIVAAGCSIDADPESARDIPGVFCAVGNDGKPRLAQLVADALGRRAGAEAPPATEAEPRPAEPSPWPSISSFAGHTRAFVKIQDGCDRFCSYCIVPYVRGRARSRPAEEVVREVGRLIAAGYLEVVLTGIHLGHYGSETDGGPGLVPLLERVLAAGGLRRLRLSSIELGEVTDRLLDLFAASHVLCPHLHIPLQSGDDDVLLAMNRHYTAADFLARVEAVRRRMPDAAITTDAIVGFPGETDEQFRHTLEAARRAAFSRMHVFPYSDRAGTAAARMAGKVPRQVIAARRRELLATASELAEAYHGRFVGRDVEVLVETRRDRRTGLLCGYSRHYVRGFFDGPDRWQGKLVDVRATQASRRGVIGGVTRDA